MEDRTLAPPPRNDLGEKRGADTGRHSAVIMFTDIVGYSSLSLRDEARALLLLEEHRKLVRQVFLRHKGREIKTIGDSFLVEFHDPTSAVICAYEIQKSLARRNSSCEPENKVAIRIGLHYGDILYVDNGKDVYGNCVNIASRIEPLADPGGICLTSQVFDLFDNSSGLKFENLGEHDLKNISTPISILKVLLPWQEQDQIATERKSGNEAVLKMLTDLQTIHHFVDRDQERRRLTSFLGNPGEKGSSSSLENGKVILIGGEAGVGKTRLVDWFIEESMKQKGANVARGYCQAEISIPYFPFSDAFGRFLSEAQGKPSRGPIALAGWLETSATAHGYNPKIERDRMFEGTLRLLSRLSNKTLFMLCLEDIHWADTASLALLHYLARNTKQQNVLIVCTYRSDEITKTTEGKMHPLEESILLMSKENVIHSIELSRLDQESVRNIAESVLGQGNQPDILDFVARESGGNPLYAVEYARLLKGEKDNETRAIKNQTDNMPQSVRDVILRRLGRLQTNDRHLLNCASLMGERIDPVILSNALGLDSFSTLERLDTIARDSRIIRENLENKLEPGFIFDHAKIREVVRDGLSSILRKELHQRIADSLQKKYSDDRADELVFHYREAGVHEKVLKLAPLAASQARVRYANTEAVKYYTWALEATTEVGLKTTKGEALAARLGRAYTFLSLGKYEQALEDSKEVLANSTDPSLRIPAIRISAEASFENGWFSRSLELCNYEELQENMEIAKTERLIVRIINARITGYRGDPHFAIAELKRAIKELQALGEKVQYALALLALKELQLTIFDLQGAQKANTQARIIFHKLGDLEGEMSALQSMAGIFSFLGDFDNADKSYAKAAELGNKIGVYGSLVWIYLYWGLLLESAGDYENALRVSLRALDNANISQSPYGKSAVYANLTRCYLRTNRNEEAENAYFQMNKLFEERARDASLTLSSAVIRTRGFYNASHREFMRADSEYTESISLLQNAPLGPLHDLETRLEYASFLKDQHRNQEVSEQLFRVREIYEKLGNVSGVKKIEKLLSSIKR